MNILFLATDDNLGAGTSLYRIAHSARKQGHECTMLVKNKTRNVNWIFQLNENPSIFKKIINKARSIAGRKKIETDPDYYFFNSAENKSSFTGEKIASQLSVKPDIIYAGWISGFVNTKALADLSIITGAKVFWLMTDMAPITGGCHYAWDCSGYEHNCNNCPAILNNKFKGWANKNFLLKLEHIKRAGIDVIAGSGWTHTQASKAKLFEHQKTILTFNGCVDMNVFNDKNRDIAKKIFNFPPFVKVILCGATFTKEKRKGMSLFVDALQKLWEQLPDTERHNTCILIAGSNLAENELISGIPFNKFLIDYIKDDRLLSLAYQAADVFVCPSIEDSGPMMVNEALACGTPVVGFDMGLINNMIINDHNGYKAILGDTADLAKGIRKILSLTPDEAKFFSQNAVSKIVQDASDLSVARLLTALQNSPHESSNTPV